MAGLKQVVLGVEIPPSRGLQRITPVFLDLSGSSAAKLTAGHQVAVANVMLHNGVATQLAKRFGASAIKELGDGVLAVFLDPRDAVRAAVNVVVALRRHARLPHRAGVASGMAQQVMVGKRSDYLGDTVDRAARIQSAALPGQVLTDQETFGNIQAFIPERSGVRVSQPIDLQLAGIGTVSLREVVATRSPTPSTQWVPAALWIDELGRPPLAQKVRFVAAATEEVIEIGAGLTTFADFFTAHRREAFKDHVAALVKSGVQFRCLVADPDDPALQTYVADRGENDYRHQVADSIAKLRAVSSEMATLPGTGSFEVYIYDRIPMYAATCVDVGEDRPSGRGRISVSNYLPGVPRADAPVFRFSASSNEGLFRRYWSSARELLRSARWADSSAADSRPSQEPGGSRAGFKVSSRPRHARRVGSLSPEVAIHARGRSRASSGQLDAR